MARNYTPEEKETALRLRLENGKTFQDIQRITGIPKATVSAWAREDAAERAKVEEDTLGATFETPPEGVPDVEPIREHVTHEHPPRRPPDGRSAPAPDIIDYKELAGYIEGFYGMAAQLAATDPALRDAIQAHAKEAGVAWSEWIRSEPKVAAMLQRMMIGTPLGKVIGVHVSIVIGYVFARNLQRDISAAAQADSATP